MARVLPTAEEVEEVGPYREAGKEELARSRRENEEAVGNAACDARPQRNGGNQEREYDEGDCDGVLCVVDVPAVLTEVADAIDGIEGDLKSGDGVGRALSTAALGVDKVAGLGHNPRLWPSPAATQTVFARDRIPVGEGCCGRPGESHGWLGFRGEEGVEEILHCRCFSRTDATRERERCDAVVG